MPGLPFRCNFHLDPDLSVVVVVPLTNGARPGRQPAGGVLSGPEELRQFIAEVGLDSVVTRQQRPGPRYGPLVVDLSFWPTSADKIVATLKARAGARLAADIRILEGEPPPEDIEGAPQSFMLGASNSSTEEGARRVSEWFAKRRTP